MIPLPTTIYLLDETAWERLDYDDPTGIAGHHGVAFVPVPLRKGAPTWQLDLQRRGQLQADTILVHDPLRPGTYVPIEEADWQLAVSKSQAFVEVCQHLGARAVNVTLVHEHKKRRRTTIEVEGGTLVGAGGSGSFRNEATQHLAADLKISTTNHGGLADPERAQQILNAAGLDGDPVIQGLVNAFSNANNPPKQRDISVNLSSEATRTLQATAKLKAPAYFHIGVDVKHIHEEATQFTVDYHVDFSTD